MRGRQLPRAVARDLLTRLEARYPRNGTTSHAGHQLYTSTATVRETVPLRDEDALGLSATELAAGTELDPVAAGWTAATPPASYLRVHAMGDSITAGGGSDAAWRGRFQDRCKADGRQVAMVGSVASTTDGAAYDHLHDGHPGWRIDHLQTGVVGQESAGYAALWLPAWPADVVFVHAGTNDVAQNYDVPTMLTRHAALIAVVRGYEPAVKIILWVPPKITSGLYPWADATLQSLQAAMPAFVAGYTGVTWWSGYDAITDPSTQLNPDGTHPNAAGNVVLGDGAYAAFVSATS